jgi:hypothetical protein
VIVKWCVEARGVGWSLTVGFGDAVKEAVGADEEFAVADRGGGVEVAVVCGESVLGEDFEARFSGEDEDPVPAAGEVNSVGGDNGRGVDRSTPLLQFSDSFAVDLVSRFGIDAKGDARIVDPVKVSLVEDRGGDV